MLVPKKKGASMHTTVVVNQPSSFCMDITYFLKPADGMKNETVTVDIKPLDKQNNVSRHVIVEHLDHEWKNHRLEATAPLAIGKYNISVAFSSENFFIGDIHFCTKGM
jgi:hypothetical protein